MPSPTLNPEVVTALQASVAAHWTAVEFYTTVAAHLRRWGYIKLAAKAEGESDGERDHLALLLDRLEYGDVAPTLTHRALAWPRHDVAGMLGAALALETEAARVENAGAVTARQRGDEPSARIFGELAKASEESAAELTAALDLINVLGLANYLQAQL